MGSWLTGWDMRMSCAAQASQIGGNSTETTLILNLEEFGTPEFWLAVALLGIDIRVTQSDGVTEEPFELVNFDKAGEAGYIRLLGSSVSDAGTVFKVYAGNPLATAYDPTDPLGSENADRDAIKAHFTCESTAVLLDSTSNGNDSIASSGTKSLETGPFSSHGIAFGASVLSYYKVPDLDIHAAFTIMFMCNPSDVSSRVPMAQWNSGDQAFHPWMNGSSKLAVGLSSDGSATSDYAANTTLTADEWQHHIISFGSDLVDLYLNGTPDMTTGAFTGPVYDSAREIWIGNQEGGNSTTNLQGPIADISLFNEKISDDEALTIGNNRADQPNFWVVTNEMISLSPIVMVIL